MKRFCKPLFLVGFSIACVAFIASGLFLTQASDKKNRNGTTPGPARLPSPVLTEDSPSITAVISPDVVISQVYGGGGNSGATYTHDFIELFNRGNSSVSLDGWSIQYASATGTGNFGSSATQITELPNVTLSPGQYYLVQQASGANGVALPAPDLIDATPIAMATAGGKVALATISTSLECNGGSTLCTPAQVANIKDLVGYGSANFFEGAAATGAPSNTTAAFRNSGGCADTDDNSSDFAVAAVSPRNGASPLNACGSTPTPQKPNVDMNGDGRTDFVITRPGGSSALTEAMLAERRTTSGRRSRTVKQSQMPGLTAGDQTPWQWWSQNNGAAGGFVVDWGLLFTDTTVSGDFDGDGADDIAIWRPDPQSAFYSLDSSDFTFRYVAFGLPGDDPSVIGDYDGDGIDDPAVYRCPIGPPADTCYFFVAYSLNNPTGHITWEPWGFGTSSDWIPYPGDFNGDGKADFCVQNITNPNQAVFWLRHSQVPGHEVIHWGLPTDRVVPGDFDGDGRSDFTVVRVNEVDFRYTFWTLFRDGGIRVRDWGEDPDDITPGDYDGDGKTDLAIYRWWQPTPAFWILPSNGDPHRVFHWGSEGDFPLAKWQVQ